VVRHAGKCKYLQFAFQGNRVNQDIAQGLSPCAQICGRWNR
jgi:hypothetical protein